MISKFPQAQKNVLKSSIVRLFAQVQGEPLRNSEKWSSLTLPKIDISSFTTKGVTPDAAEAKKLADSLYKYGAVAIKDNRVDESRNSKFLDLMEKYFENRSEIYYRNGFASLTEASPESGFQVGVTPELVELPRNHEELLKHEFLESQPVSPQPPIKDGKWRYFWRIRDEELSKMDSDLLPAQIIPSDFEDWEPTMNGWGNLVKTYF